MIKRVAVLGVALALAVVTAGCGPRRTTASSTPKAGLSLYVRGSAMPLAIPEREAARIRQEAERLLSTAAEAKPAAFEEAVAEEARKGNTLEIVYPEVRSIVLRETGAKVLFTSLLVPLKSRQIAAGTVLFRGGYAKDYDTPTPSYTAVRATLGAVHTAEELETLTELVGEAKNLSREITAEQERLWREYRKQQKEAR